MIPAGSIIFESEVQPSNAEDSIKFTDEGIEISWSDVHFSKAEDPIDFIDGGLFNSNDDVIPSNV